MISLSMSRQQSKREPTTKINTAVHFICSPWDETNVPDLPKEVDRRANTGSKQLPAMVAINQLPNIINLNQLLVVVDLSQLFTVVKIHFVQSSNYW